MISNKVDLYRALADKTGKDQKEVEEFYDALVDVIAENLNTADESFVHLPSLGKVRVRPVPQHMGINPKTKEPLLIPASRRVRIKFFPKFVERINKEYIEKADK